LPKAEKVESDEERRNGREPSLLVKGLVLPFSWVSGGDDWGKAQTGGGSDAKPVREGGVNSVNGVQRIK